MGLEEPPHCPFDVMEACRTGVRRDSHQPGWRSSRPTAWPSPFRDRQDDGFERQEVRGRDGCLEKGAEPQEERKGSCTRKDDEEWLKMTRVQRRN